MDSFYNYIINKINFHHNIIMSCNDYDNIYLFIALSAFFISEFLPFIEKHKGNGLFHTIHCIINSDCHENDNEDNENNIV